MADLKRFKVPRSTKELREVITDYKVIEILSNPVGAATTRTVGEGIITRENLCELIHVNPAPLTSEEPIVRDAFRDWFHRYLRVLRRMLQEADAPVVLLYPDYVDENGAVIDGDPPAAGRGIALLRARSEAAVLMLLESRSRRVMSANRCYLDTVRLMAADDNPLLAGVSKENRKLIREVLRAHDSSMNGAVRISAVAMDMLFQQLPTLKYLPHQSADGETDKDDDTDAE